MKKLFLYDNGIEYSYRDLLDSIQKQNEYSPVFRDGSLFEFYVNLLTGIISDLPLTLVDSDITEKEIINLDINDIRKKISVFQLSFNSLDELLKKLHNSKSTISIFTSGTTGLPKKVDHTIKSLTKDVRKSTSHGNDVWGFAYNPTHMAGLQVFFQALANGSSMINVFGKTRNDVLDAIERYRITHISATPTFYRLLKPVEKSYPSVKRITFGGERSGDGLYESISQMFPEAKITNVYASTEGGTLLVSRGEYFQIPSNCKEKFMVDNHELLIHKNLLGTSDTFKFEGDFYRTGDIIEWIDETDGVFRFINRKNDLINVGGYKVNPSEVEEAIREIPYIIDVKVYSKSNSVIGNILCADIVSEDSKRDNDKTYIFNYLKNKLQDYKIPRIIKFKDKLDMTRTGKIKR